MTKPVGSTGWHMDYLDSLRGIAVLGVVMVHSGMFMEGRSRLFSLTNGGQRGVQLFFIVSAFTLFLSNDHRKEERHPTRNFFLRRVFRIVPMYYVATAAVCILEPQLAGPKKDVILSLLFLHGFSATAISHGALGGWSVATEAIFYLCLPLLFRTIRSLSTALKAVFVSGPFLFVVSISLALTYYPNADYFAFYWFPVEFPVFALGILSYFFWKRYIEPSKAPQPELSAVLLVLAGLLCYLDIPSNYKNMYPVSIAGALLLIALSLHRWPFFVNRFTTFIGKISYSVYLLHPYFVLAVAPHVHRIEKLKAHPSQQFVLIFAGALATSIPAAYLTWRWIEIPGIQLGRRIIAHLEGVAIRQTSDASQPV